VDYEQPSFNRTLSADAERHVADVCRQFEAAWKSGARPSIQEFLEVEQEPARSSLLRRLLLIELRYCGDRDESASRKRYHALFPDQMDLIDSLLTGSQTQGAADDTQPPHPVDPDLTATRDIAGALTSASGQKRRDDSRRVHPVDIPDFINYEVLDLIGRGGMGLVVKARDKTLKRLVAIKLPLPGRMADAEDRERFLREARSAASLRHPHICPIYEVGEADGRPYLAMGFIDGQTLADWSKSRDASPREVAGVVAALARAVSYAHKRDVVHRDIKPANVMIDAETGNPMLMDFGLAKNLAEEDVQLTQSGQVMGTPVYMAPEQAAGQIEKIGPPADIYALGVVLYVLLCGQRPFQGSFGEVLKQVQTSEPAPPRRIKPGLHRDLETICLKAMAKEASRRYESAAALAEDLERFCAGEAILARREPLVRKLVRTVRRNPLVAASAVVVLAAVVAAGLLAVRNVQVQRTAMIGREVDAKLNGLLLDESYLREAEAKIAELEQLAPDEAAEARRRLNRIFESKIRTAIHQPTLPTPEVARIEQAISLLEDRAPALVAPLHQALAERRRTWQPVFQLAPPYDNVDDIFVSREVTPEDGQLTRAGPSGGRKMENSLLTSQPSVGNVELHAVFKPGWSSATEIGLILNGRERDGYRFIVRPEGAPALQTANDAIDDEFTFNTAKELDSTVSVAIYRGGTLLTETRRAARRLVGGELRLEARREGNWLTFRVNDGNLLRFRDIFSTSSREPGHFGVMWAEDVPLASLRGYRQELSTGASPLERGDELYLLGRFNDARNLYREQAIASADTPAAVEARYKEALCLLALQYDNEAAEQLEKVAASPDTESEGDWPLLAASRLWLLRLQQGRSDEADAVYQSLSSRYRFQELAALVPENLRREILDQYRVSGAGVNLLAFNPDRVRDLERAVQVERFLRVPPISHVHAQRSLVRAYRLEGRYGDAIRFAEEIVTSESPEEIVISDNLVEEYSWLVRIHGDPRQALREIDRRLFESAGVYRNGQIYLLVERARIHAALKQWSQAAQDIDEFFRLVGVQDVGYHYYSAASLILGFLRQREGDQQGALEAWRQGRDAAPQGNRGLLSVTGGSNLMQLLSYMMLSSLSGEMTDDEGEAIMRKVFQSQSAGSVGAVFQSAVKVPPSVAREMWRSQRGRQTAEQLAFQSVTFADYIRLPAIVAATEYVHQNGFGGETSADDDAIIWELAERVYSEYQQGRLGAPHLLQLGLAWKGTTSAFGWGGVKNSLQPELRALLAYTLGHRYRRLHRPDDAKDFFQLAAKDAPDDSPVRRRAQEELANSKTNR
jgi:tetratricopeptide (TPR) repeat protein